MEYSLFSNSLPDLLLPPTTSSLGASPLQGSPSGPIGRCQTQPILFLAAIPSAATLSEFPVCGALLLRWELQGPVGWGGLAS